MHVWGKDESSEVVRDFATKQGIRYPVLLQGAGVAREYDVTGVPTNVLVDPQGKISAGIVGFPGEKLLEGLIKGILPPGEDGKK